MKQLVIALSGKTPQLKSALIPALKVFAKHNRDLPISLFGYPKQTNVLVGNTDFTLTASSQSLVDALRFAKETPETGAIVFASRSDLLDSYRSFEDPAAVQGRSLGVLLPSRQYHRSVFFLDLGLNPSPDLASFQQSLQFAKAFVSDVLWMKNPTYSLMYPFAPIPGSPSFLFDQESQKDPSYKGLLPPNAILEGRSDIVIGESLVIVSALEGAKGAIQAFDEVEASEIRKSVFFRFGKWCLKDVNKTMTDRFDRKFYGNGLFVLGSPFPLIGLEEGVGYGGLMNALELEKRWLYLPKK